jgi:AcrR family transcriptional regulator
MPKRADHDARRRQIIEAVWRITARGGLGAASFREVASEAGVSVRLVQYYFGTKADLLHAANDAIGERMAARVLQRVEPLGADAPPRALVDAVLTEFLPDDDESREAMLLFFAFYTAQMTDVSIARTESRHIAEGMVTFIANQIRRAQATGDAPENLDPDLEGVVLTSAVPGIASSVLVGYLSPEEARSALDYAIARVFPV